MQDTDVISLTQRKQPASGGNSVSCFVISSHWHAAHPLTKATIQVHFSIQDFVIRQLILNRKHAFI